MAAPRVVVLVPKGGTDLTRRLALPVKYACVPFPLFPPSSAPLTRGVRAHAGGRGEQGRTQGVGEAAARGEQRHLRQQSPLPQPRRDLRRKRPRTAP